MKVKTSKSNRNAAAKVVEQSVPAAVPADGLTPEAFLQDAIGETKRSLLMDHIQTIRTLRDKKRFTFRAISDWLGERGVETDHSAVYRVYLAAVPEEDRAPFEDWSETEEVGYGDESIAIKTPKR